MNQEKEFSYAYLIADIRAAVGDKEGRLMQDELVERCKELNSQARNLPFVIASLRDAMRREAEARAVLSTIVELSPEYENSWDTLTCFFCSADLEYGEDHDPDCPYIAAKRLIKDV